MRKDKKIVIKLRKEGKSYGQISQKFSIPKSTLSYWLRDVKLSKSAKEKIAKRVNDTSVDALIRRNKAQTQLAKERSGKIRKNSEKEFYKMKSNKLFLIGLSLYWAEGYKKGASGSKWKSVDFTNSDPEMIKIMMRFFREICKIEDEKIKVQLLLHENLDSKKIIRFWSEIVGLPKKQFMKPCCVVNKYSKRKRNKSSLIYGTIHIRINDVKWFFRIIGWLDGLKNWSVNQLA